MKGGNANFASIVDGCGIFNGHQLLPAIDVMEKLRLFIKINIERRLHKAPPLVSDEGDERRAQPFGAPQNTQMLPHTLSRSATRYLSDGTQKN